MTISEIYIKILWLLKQIGVMEWINQKNHQKLLLLDKIIINNFMIDCKEVFLHNQVNNLMELNF